MPRPSATAKTTERARVTSTVCADLRHHVVVSAKVRYRWRTTLRQLLPYTPPLYMLVPKGRKDCGDHAWYNADNVVEHCLHCIAERPYVAAHFRDL